MIKITSLDHLVLTVTDIDATCDFYQRVLGMEVLTFGEGRTALRYGSQKINLHQAGAEFEPRAMRPSPGSADLCFLIFSALDDVIRHMKGCGVPIVEGPVERTGATGPIRSLYIRDPDGNLLELSRTIT